MSKEEGLNPNKEYSGTSNLRDVILPMVVLRRLDSLLEPTKEKVLNVKKIIEKFNLKTQIRHMAAKDVLLDVL